MTESRGELPTITKGSEQHHRMLADVLFELQKTSIPTFDYPTRVANGYGHFFLEELIPRVEKRRFRKDLISEFGRIAIRLEPSESGIYTVYQPRWLAPLQEEVSAISALLPEQPEIEPNYVVAWRRFAGHKHVDTGELVPEVQIKLSESRQLYWTAKVKMLNAESHELPAETSEEA